jgi:Ca-activated chloride channel family protein
LVTPARPRLEIHAFWDRPIVPTEGGPAILVTQIIAGPNPNPVTTRPPLDIAFVLDRSGSMSGEPLELVKQAVSVALDFLDDRDRVSLITFDHNIKMWQELTPATSGARTLLRNILRIIRVGGSTNLTGGWQAGCEQLAADATTSPGRVRRTILLTDGQANIGVTDPAAITSIATDYRERGVGTTTVGVGLHFDEMLLSAMSEAGGGNFAFVEHPAALPDIFARETGSLANTVAISPRLALTLAPGVTGQLLNTFPARIDGTTMLIDLRDLVAGDELTLVMELTIPPGTENSIVALSATLQVGLETSLPVSIPTLRRRPAREVDIHPRHPDVQQHHALERSALARREAIRRDREGDIAGSRQVLRETFAYLQSIPQSAEIETLSADIDELAASPIAFDEATRKRVVHEGHAHSRGNRQG